VRAAIDSAGPNAVPLPPHIANLIAPIAPAVHRVGGVDNVTPVDPEQIDASAVGREHLRDTVADLLKTSEMISDAVAEGKLGIVGANYRLQEGRAVPDLVLGIT
jgi:carbonic anhydrase